MPEGWEQAVRERDGKIYYIDHTTRTTTFERPTIRLKPASSAIKLNVAPTGAKPSSKVALDPRVDKVALKPRGVPTTAQRMNVVSQLKIVFASLGADAVKLSLRLEVSAH